MVICYLHNSNTVVKIIVTALSKRFEVKFFFYVKQCEKLMSRAG